MLEVSEACGQTRIQQPRHINASIDAWKFGNRNRNSLSLGLLQTNCVTCWSGPTVQAWLLENATSKSPKLENHFPVDASPLAVKSLLPLMIEIAYLSDQWDFRRRLCFCRALRFRVVEETTHFGTAHLLVIVGVVLQESVNPGASSYSFDFALPIGSTKKVTILCGVEKMHLRPCIRSTL